MSNENPHDSSLMAKAPKFRFTIGSMLILTTVFAAFSVSLGYYVKALWASGSLEWMGGKPPTAETVTGTEVGMFAIVAAMVPTVFLVVASCFLKAAAFIGKLMR